MSDSISARSVNEWETCQRFPAEMSCGCSPLTRQNQNRNRLRSITHTHTHTHTHWDTGTHEESSKESINQQRENLGESIGPIPSITWDVTRVNGWKNGSHFLLIF